MARQSTSPNSLEALIAETAAKPTGRNNSELSRYPEIRQAIEDVLKTATKMVKQGRIAPLDGRQVYELVRKRTARLTVTHHSFRGWLNNDAELSKLFTAMKEA